MLESLTIFTKGGLILYQYLASPSLIGDDEEGLPGSLSRDGINLVLEKVILTSSTKEFHISQGVTFTWRLEKDYIVMAVYPDIMFEGPRQYLKEWAEALIQRTMCEYNLYYKSSSSNNQDLSLILQRPDPKPFDKTFRVLLDQSKTQRPAGEQPPTSSSTATAAASETKTNDNNKSSSASGGGGKEKRQWHDGKAKVTEKAMAELDRSGDKSSSTDATSLMEAQERALAEARKTYLPSESELQEQLKNGNSNNSTNDDDDVASSSSSWSSSVTGLLQQLTGNKILTASDLQAPLEQMRDLLLQKNVARDIANHLCASVQSNLVGKKLNTLHRTQTAVAQGMEKAVRKLLQPKQKQVDLLRAVMTKRGDGSFFSTSSNSPYVIVVMGINGIGKTTSLAKLAYYLSNNNCHPLLVAGDTFRSGAVEQLQVHADCLQVPLFSQGYAKDPSAVAKAAIQYATDNKANDKKKHDVVLIDTAGRMQNNVPLMKALGKLVNDNKPDAVLFVCEALVGHDGLNQYQMFKQAISPRTIDGLILTKYDTVSDKVGAALTLTHETGAPILFVGTGQKYHHLQQLNVSSVINSLFS